MKAQARWDEAYVGEHVEEDLLWDDEAVEAPVPEAPAERAESDEAVDQERRDAEARHQGEDAEARRKAEEEAQYRAWDEEQREIARERRRGNRQPRDNGTRGSDSDLLEVVIARLRDHPPERMVTVEVERHGLVEREDGTVMRVGEEPKYGGRMRGQGAGWQSLGRRLNVALASAVPSQHDLIALFGLVFQGRQEEALRVAKVKPKGDYERALKDDVRAFANAFRAHRARDPLAEFFGVSVTTISSWRKLFQTLHESDDG